MKSLYEELPPVEIGGRKLVGRVLFGLLVLVSALVGATAGLLLVYTTDLPQVEAVRVDLSDDVYIATALVGAAGWVVSGDRHLLTLKRFAGVSIVTPGQFFGELRR